MPDASKVVKVTCDVVCWPPGFVKKPPRLLIMPAHVPTLACCGRRHGHPLGSVLPREGPGLQSAWVRFEDPLSGRPGQLVTEACILLTPAPFTWVQCDALKGQCFLGIKPGPKQHFHRKCRVGASNRALRRMAAACVESRHVASQGSLSLGNSH